MRVRSEIAQRIEQGEWTIYEALCGNQVVLKELLRLNELAVRDRTVLRELVDYEPDEPLDAKATDRIKSNLKVFKQIGTLDKKIQSARKRQKRYKEGGDRYMEIERDIDRLVAKIAESIRSIDFSLQTRNQLVDLLKDLDRKFSRGEQNIRRAKIALERGKQQGAAGAASSPDPEVQGRAQGARDPLRNSAFGGHRDRFARSGAGSGSVRRPRRS